MRRSMLFAACTVAVSYGAVLLTLPRAGRILQSLYPTYQNKFLVVASPTGTYQATFYNYGKLGDGGATVSRPIFVNVRRHNHPFVPESGQVFIMRHGYQLRFVWEDEHRLRIEYPNGADVDKKEERWEDASIVYKPVAKAQLPDSYAVLHSK